MHKPLPKSAVHPVRASLLFTGCSVSIKDPSSDNVQGNTGQEKPQPAGSGRPGIEKRGSISRVEPTGWHSTRYDFVIGTHSNGN